MLNENDIILEIVHSGLENNKLSDTEYKIIKDKDVDFKLYNQKYGKNKKNLLEILLNRGV